jgi:hypothetical protein
VKESPLAIPVGINETGITRIRKEKTLLTI